jgi:hypothetical protein
LILNNNLTLVDFLYLYSTIDNKNKRLYNKNKIFLTVKKNFSLFFIQQSTNYRYNNFINYQFFNVFYLQNIFKITLKEKNLNTLKVIPQKLTKLILFKVRNVSFKKFNIKYFNEVVNLFIINIYIKNAKNLCKYIKKKLDSTHFKKHRSYFLFFFKILNKYILPNFKLLNLKGVTLSFKGKLGKGGNARKKIMMYKKGKHSLSNKMIKINSNK